MKILRIKLPENLNEPFRSLHPGFEIFFHPNLENKLIEPIGLAGLNGSGKSNLLELISEVFYYLDSLLLQFPTTAVTEDKEFGFEIDYALPFTMDNPYIRYDDTAGYTMDDTFFVVRAEKKVQGDVTYSITSVNKYPIDLGSKRNSVKSVSEVWTTINSKDKNISFLLPKKIFGYTSGQNEQLSNCYYKMQFHYFNDYKNKLKQGSLFYIDGSRLFFGDNNSNASIFVSNYLLGSSKTLSVFKDVIKIRDLHSFRITIRYADLSGKEVKELQFNYDLTRKIKLLKNCATSWYEKGGGAKKVLTIDYLVNQETKKAFHKIFGESPFDLYKVFYELEMQNFHTVPENVLELATNGPRWVNITDELPKQDPNNLIFRIEKIYVIKEDVKKEIKYKGLSDGEHQFLQVVGMILMMEENGCLFLLDEPDTHYNPLWRSRLISTINKVVKYRNSKNEKKLRLQEVLITSHSPFVLSDLKKRNVYIFKKPKNKVEFKPCHFETYGSSASIILDEIFGKEDSISEMAKQELKDLIGGVRTMNQLRDVVDKLNTQFGESVDKFEYFNKLRDLKEKLEKKKTAKKRKKLVVTKRKKLKR